MAIDAALQVHLLGAKDPKAALRKVSDELGLSFDDWDVVSAYLVACLLTRPSQDYYNALFVEMGRDPTDVELFDLAQSNSEHSRHWFFGGNMVLDGKPQTETLFQMVKSTIAPVKVRGRPRAAG
jgi:phosphoribosylformylglycinamidine synthase